MDDETRQEFDRIREAIVKRDAFRKEQRERFWEAIGVLAETDTALAARIAELESADAEMEPPPPVPDPEPEGEVLFASDFSTFDGWYVQSIKGRATITNGVAHFEVRDGDSEPDTGSERCEVSGPTFSEGQTIYIASDFSVPSSASYKGGWGAQIIQQLHETDWGGSPGIAVQLTPELDLSVVGAAAGTFASAGKIAPDAMHRLVYGVELSRTDGWVTAWLDGRRIGEGRGVTIQTAATYLKSGLYRGKSSTGTSEIDFDRIVVGTSLAVVGG